jgi:hypothetical protein
MQNDYKAKIGQAQSHVRLSFYFDLIDEAPHPIFTGFDGLHNGMFGVVEMLGGMFIF